jgi:hypothetical protein
MGIKLTYLAGVTLSFITAAAVSAPATRAQHVDTNDTPQTIPEAIDDLLTQSSGTYFENRTLGRQAASIFGFGFREREIDWDAATVSQEFNALMRFQNTSDPTIRVPDLATPFTTSLLTMPSGQAPTLGTEFIFEPF